MSQHQTHLEQSFKFQLSSLPKVTITFWKIFLKESQFNIMAERQKLTCAILIYDPITV